MFAQEEEADGEYEDKDQVFDALRKEAAETKNEDIKFSHIFPENPFGSMCLDLVDRLMGSLDGLQAIRIVAEYQKYWKCRTDFVWDRWFLDASSKHVDHYQKRLI